MSCVSSTVNVETSYTIFEDLTFGRFSFNGFNPTVEKLNASLNPSPSDGEDDDENDDEKEISDSKMAEQSRAAREMHHRVQKRFGAAKPGKDHKVKRLAEKDGGHHQKNHHH